MEKVIIPSKIHPASVAVPSSKSLSHRALITASLADGISIIHHAAENADTKATMSLMEQLGADFTYQGDDLIVHGTSALQYTGGLLDCSESGSTLRFLIPVFALLDQDVQFTGHGKLMQRPQNVYADLFYEQGLLFQTEGEILHLHGPLQAGTFRVQGNVSSQFISGLLFALPLLKSDSTIEIIEPFESASYVQLTLDALKRAGITVIQDGLTFHIKGNQKYHSFEGTVAGDDSQMAFYAEEAMIQQVPVTVQNMDHASKQGDHVIIDIIQKLGGTVHEVEGGYQFVPGDLHESVIDLADCPDLGPALFALASQCRGTTTFIHAERLRIKESDRIACMEAEMHQLGCTISSHEGTVSVTGPTAVHGNVHLNGHNDHRIVMALSVLATIADGPVVIEDAQAVSKSYPDFFIDLAQTGAEIHDQ